MCGNYGIGGHYGVHPDYHHYSKPNYNINRISTVLSVLDEPEAGGATVWPFLGVNISQKKEVLFGGLIPKVILFRILKLNMLPVLFC